jgi:hypothetical protein
MLMEANSRLKILFETEAQKDFSLLFRVFKVLSDPQLENLDSEFNLRESKYDFDKNDLLNQLLNYLPKRIIICELFRAHGQLLDTEEIAIKRTIFLITKRYKSVAMLIIVILYEISHMIKLQTIADHDLRYKTPDRPIKLKGYGNRSDSTADFLEKSLFGTVLDIENITDD